MLYISDRSAKLAGQAIVTDAEEGQFELANSTEDVYLIYDAESKKAIFTIVPARSWQGNGFRHRPDVAAGWIRTLTISGSGAIPMRQV